MTTHVSALRLKLQRLQKRYPSGSARCLEDWLLDVANARGAQVVVRAQEPDPNFRPPPLEELSNEELVVAICQPQALDRPQMLRLAAQLVSREAVAASRLCLMAERERAELVLGELAWQALRVDSQHKLWRILAERFPRRDLRSPILHWTRLAEPVMEKGQSRPRGWRLAA